MIPASAALDFDETEMVGEYPQCRPYTEISFNRLVVQETLRYSTANWIVVSVRQKHTIAEMVHPLHAVCSTCIRALRRGIYFEILNMIEQKGLF